MELKGWHAAFPFKNVLVYRITFLFFEKSIDFKYVNAFIYILQFFPLISSVIVVACGQQMAGQQQNWSGQIRTMFFNPKMFSKEYSENTNIIRTSYWTSQFKLQNQSGQSFCAAFFSLRCQLVNHIKGSMRGFNSFFTTLSKTGGTDHLLLKMTDAIWRILILKINFVFIYERIRRFPRLLSAYCCCQFYASSIFHQ